MAASICRDNFVISIVADLDCHLEVTGHGGATIGDPTNSSDTVEFVLQAGAEEALIIHFEYFLGIGFDEDHANFGFSETIDALSTGNAASMSISDGVFNPPNPDTTGAANALKHGTLTYAAAATSQISADAGDQNLGGQIILNTGV